MNRFNRLCASILWLLITLDIAVCPASEAPADEKAPVQAKTITRWPDPVVLDCALLTSIVGKPMASVRVFALHHARLEPIPFQIDERNRLGARIYLSGEEANPGDSNGRIDPGDELVFMARDAGDRMEREGIPPGAVHWEELELTDPLTGEKGWCYVLWGDPSLPLSDRDYIRYEPKCHSEEDGRDGACMRSDYVDDRFYPMPPYFDISNYENNGFSHRFMANTPAAGGNNTNYVDRMKTRFDVAIVFGRFKLHLDENRLTFREFAYTDGPVRLVRKISLIVSLPAGFKAPGICVDLLWYDTIVDVPMIVHFAMNPDLMLTYINIAQAEDQNLNAYGMLVYNSNNSGGMVIDGRTSPMEEAWDPAKDFWRLLSGPQGSTMRRSFWDPKWVEQMVSLRVDYFDDIQRRDPPEETPGFIGCIFQSNRVKDIKRGSYHSYLEWYWPPSFLFTGENGTFQPGDETTYLNMADNPILLKVGTRTMKNSYFGPMPTIAEAAPEAPAAAAP